MQVRAQPKILPQLVCENGVLQSQGTLYYVTDETGKWILDTGKTDSPVYFRTHAEAELMATIINEGFDNYKLEDISLAGVLQKFGELSNGKDSISAPLTDKQPKMASWSRPERWMHWAGVASNALSELKSIQEEYSEWKDSLPDGLSQSATADKLTEVEGLDIESAQTLAEECESIDLPRGYGRD